MGQDPLLKQLSGEIVEIGERLRQYNLDHDLLIERMHKVELQLQGLKKELPSTLKSDAELTKSHLTQMEKRLDALEKNQDQIASLLQQLQENVNSGTQRLEQQVNQVKRAMQMMVQEGTESPQSYTVKSGDTLEKIARQNKMTVERLKELNQLSKDQIRVGQQLKLHE